MLRFIEWFQIHYICTISPFQKCFLKKQLIQSILLATLSNSSSFFQIPASKQSSSFFTYRPPGNNAGTEFCYIKIVTTIHNDGQKLASKKYKQYVLRNAFDNKKQSNCKTNCQSLGSLYARYPPENLYALYQSMCDECWAMPQHCRR